MGFYIIRPVTTQPLLLSFTRKRTWVFKAKAFVPLVRTSASGLFCVDIRIALCRCWTYPQTHEENCTQCLNVCNAAMRTCSQDSLQPQCQRFQWSGALVLLPDLQCFQLQNRPARIHTDIIGKKLCATAVPQILRRRNFLAASLTIFWRASRYASRNYNQLRCNHRFRRKNTNYLNYRRL